MRNFVTSFVVGKDGGTANVGTNLESIKKGDVLIVDYNTGTVLTGTANTVDSAPVIAIVNAIEDGIPIVSGPIFGKKLVAGGKTPYTAPVNPVKGFGYTSLNAAGKLPSGLTEEQEFNVGIVLKTDLRLNPNRQDRIDLNVYSKGGYDLARKIVSSVGSNIDNNPNLTGPRYVKARITADGTPANIGTAATATVANGQRGVTFSSAHGLSAGDKLLFAGEGVFSVAQVVSTTVINLDAPYTGESKVIAATVTKKLGSAANYGVEIEALTIKRTNPVNSYSQVNFEIGLSANFESNVDTITEYVRGIGTGWQVHDMEVSTMGNVGFTDRNSTKIPEFPFQTDLGKNYLTVSVSSNAPVRGDLQQTFEGPQAVFIAFDNAAATQATAVLAILNPWTKSGGVSLD